MFSVMSTAHNEKRIARPNSQARMQYILLQNRLFSHCKIKRMQGKAPANPDVDSVAAGFIGLAVILSHCIVCVACIFAGTATAKQDGGFLLLGRLGDLFCELFEQGVHFGVGVFGESYLVAGVHNGRVVSAA